MLGAREERARRDAAGGKRGAEVREPAGDTDPDRAADHRLPLLAHLARGGDQAGVGRRVDCAGESAAVDEGCHSRVDIRARGLGAGRPGEGGAGWEESLCWDEAGGGVE